MALRLVQCLVLVAACAIVVPAALLAATPEQAFEFLFGKEAAQVAAGKDKAASADLAGRILSAAAGTKDDAALRNLLYEKAYDFGATGPAGYVTAATAARQLIELEPERKLEWQEKLLPILRAQQAAAKTAPEKAGAGQILAEHLTAMAESQAESGTADKLALYYQQASGMAQGLASPAKEDLAARLKPIQAKIAPLRQAEQLRVRFAADPQNKTLAETLLRLYLVDLDNPVEAVKYADLGADEVTRNSLLVAAMKVDGLPENACLTLADWYNDLADSVKGPARAAMLRRVLAYSDQFARLHPADDLLSKKAKLLFEKAQKELVKSGSGEAGTVDILKYVDPKKDFLEGSWSFQNGVLISSGNPSRLQLSYHPPEEYDFEVTFQMLRPNSGANMILCRPGGQFSWACSSYENTLVGFELINGQEVKANPTTTKFVLAPGAKHISLVQVRKDSVKGLIDGKLIVEWKTDGKDLSLYEGYRQPDSECLGLATWYGSVAFQSIRVTEIGGRGKIMHDSVTAATPAPTPTATRPAVTHTVPVKKGP